MESSAELSSEEMDLDLENVGDQGGYNVVHIGLELYIFQICTTLELLNMYNNFFFENMYKSEFSDKKNMYKSKWNMYNSKKLSDI